MWKKDDRNKLADLKVHALLRKCYLFGADWWTSASSSSESNIIISSGVWTLTGPGLWMNTIFKHKNQMVI